MTDRTSAEPDNRGVSAVVSYVLVLGIVAILTSALFVSFAPFVTNQQHDTTYATLDVLSNDIVSDIDTVDRLAVEAGENETVELRKRLPDRVGGSPYEIEIKQRDSEMMLYEITLRTAEPDVSATATVRTQTPLEEKTGADALDGDSLVISYETDKNGGKLVIENE